MNYMQKILYDIHFKNIVYWRQDLFRVRLAVGFASQTNSDYCGVYNVPASNDEYRLTHII